MGIVYLAEHTGLARLVALKLLLPELDQSAFVERFRREARILATLKHRHIVEIHDFDVASDGIPFYVMERLEGCSLADALARIGRPLLLAEICGIVGELAKALEYAHRLRIVHRDLKPDNVFLSLEDGVVVPKLLDFGIAKHIDHDEGQARLTSTGAVMGTPLYLTPEQLVGEEVVPATDQFALALIVAECLLGHPLRQGQTVTQMLKQAIRGTTTDALDDARISAEVRALLRTATAYDPAQRHVDVTAFVVALAALATHDDRQWVEQVITKAPGIREVTTATTPMPAMTTPVPAGARQAPATVVTGDAAVPTHRVAQEGTKTPPRRTAWRMVALGLLAIVGCTLAWWLRPAQPPAPVASTDAGANWLHASAPRDTPADAGKLLGIISAGAVLRTAGGTYLLPLQGTGTATRQTLPADEEVIGVAAEGGLFVRSGGRLLERDAKGTGERVIGAFDHAAERVLAVDPQATRFVVANAKAATLVAADGVRHKLDSLPVERILHLQLGRAHLLAALTQPSELRLVDPQLDQVLWSASMAATRLYDLAWLEDSGDIATCAFSPQIELFNTRNDSPARRVDIPVSCYATRWLADGPSLVIRADRSLLLWRDQQVQRIAWPHAAGAIDSELPRIVAGDDQLWIGEPDSNALHPLLLGGPAPPPLHEEPLGEIWDIDKGVGAVHVGVADGGLWRVTEGKAQRFAVHDAGITDIVDGGDAIATASDDRTIAVWKLPDMSIRWRTRGHEFLVNQLWLDADHSALWSSSSDGSVKRWRWPDLEVEEVVDVRALTGIDRLSLHALWLDADASRALVGSWNHRLVHLRRDTDGWASKELPVAGAGGYRFQHVSGVDAVMVLTTMPTRLYAWDLRLDELLPAPDFDLSLLALAEGPDAMSAFAAGPGVVMLHRLRRDTDGTLVIDASVRQVSALGAVTAASVDREHAGWIVAAEGRVLRVPWSWFEPAVTSGR